MERTPDQLYALAKAQKMILWCRDAGIDRLPGEAYRPGLLSAQGGQHHDDAASWIRVGLRDKNGWVGYPQERFALQAHVTLIQEPDSPACRGQGAHLEPHGQRSVDVG